MGSFRIAQLLRAVSGTQPAGLRGERTGPPRRVSRCSRRTKLVWNGGLKDF